MKTYVEIIRELREDNDKRRQKLLNILELRSRFTQDMKREKMKYL